MTWCCRIMTKPTAKVAEQTAQTLSHQEIIALVLLGVVAICLLAWAFSTLAKVYRVVEENEQLREYVAVHDERRIRGLQYFTDTLCRYDEGYLDYHAQKQLGHLPTMQPENKPPLRIHDYQVNMPQRDDWDNPPHHRQPETRVVYVHAAPPREPQMLAYWRDDDNDDVIDIEPIAPAPNPHRAMPQMPLLGSPKGKGGRPRKYANAAERKRAYDQRQRSRTA